MSDIKGHPSVILLLDRDGDRDLVRAWLQNSRFCLLEADDVFDALDELSDCTTRDRPDVVLVPMDPASDLTTIDKLVRFRSDNGELSVIAYPSRSTETVDGRIDDLKTHLDRLIPPLRSMSLN